MKFLLLTGLLLIHGCASYHPRQDTQPRVNTPSKKPESPKAESKKVIKDQSGAVWELLNKNKITLYFKNVDDGSNLNVIIGKGMTQKVLPLGHWELTGFSSEGRTFTSMNTTRKFVFGMKPGALSYAGSIVIGCPKVTNFEFHYLKGMKFFNRYPFSSKSGLCEMIIGNDFAQVSQRLKKVRKNKNLDLVLGF